MTEKAILAIDAGGSVTSLRIRTDKETAEVKLPSVNPASVGCPQAVINAKQCMRAASEIIGNSYTFGCIAGAFVQLQNFSPSQDQVITALMSEAPQGQYVFVNDVVPLILSPPMSGNGIVISSGTGSCVIGRDYDGKIVALGGHEYVLSDAGSAYAIGLAGLRVAAETYDGLTGGEKLLAECRQMFGMDVPTLGRHLSGSPNVKVEVASFAPSVCAAAEQGDGAARKIIGEAALALARYAREVGHNLNCEPPLSIGLGGGVLMNCPGLANAVATQLRDFGVDFRPVTLNNLDCAAWLAINNAHSSANDVIYFSDPDSVWTDEFRATRAAKFDLKQMIALG